MNPVDAIMWCIAAALALVVLSALYLVGWFILDTLRGKR